MAAAEQSSSQYDQEEKKQCRSRLIKHAVNCLTAERNTSACVLQDHVKRVWKQLCEAGKTCHFTPEDRQEIEREIETWERFHDSKIQTRKPSDLRVCYLGGDNPINDLEVLIDNGVLCQNVWVIEKDSKTLKDACESIKESELRNVRLFKGDILTFFKDHVEQFDIIYFDACGSLPSATQNTLKVIGYVFHYNKLASPGALITNFSFPPKQQKDALHSNASNEERERIQFLVEEYLKYRQINTYKHGLDAANLKNRTDEDNYGDYITYQIIDSAYLYIPAQRMLLSTRNSLWDQIYAGKKEFFKDLKCIYDVNSSKKSNDLTKDGGLSKAVYEDIAKDSYLRNIGSVLNSEVSNPLCVAWVNEIFPDWKASQSLKKEDISLLLLTPLLFCSEEFISTFSNACFASCLRQLNALLNQKQSKFISCCDEAITSSSATCLIAGLLYGQLACPSFPVVNKLLRLSYTAKERQMFSDVFIFDKCRYVYDQFPTVDCAYLAIVEPKQQMVIRMVVDGLRKHLYCICYNDVFKFCNVTSIGNGQGGVIAIPNSGQYFPQRQKVLVSDLEEAGIAGCIIEDLS